MSKLRGKIAKIIQRDMGSMFVSGSQGFLYFDKVIDSILTLLRTEVEKATCSETGCITADEVTLEFFRKYLKMPKATLEGLCRKIETLVEPASEEKILECMTNYQSENVDKVKQIFLEDYAKALFKELSE